MDAHPGADRLGPIHSRPVAGGREIEDVQAPQLGNSGAALPSDLLTLLRCLECTGPVRLVSLSEHPGYPELGPDGRLRCDDCGEDYPLIAGTARMLGRAMRGRLVLDYPLAHDAFQEQPGAPRLPRRRARRAGRGGRHRGEDVACGRSKTGSPARRDRRYRSAVIRGSPRITAQSSCLCRRIIGKK